ncbi:MAG TPA: SpoIIE family protein phosphatase [Mycobacteriales bacterium]|nr:SpoIIE family protein phosphatase [Mycobacteriales bacterium]
MLEAWQDELTLVPDETAPSRARQFVRAALEDNGWVDFLEGALLLATELVTNAVVHAGTAIAVSVAGDDHELSIRVQDRMPGRMSGSDRLPDDLHEGGRGLFLVDALATSWGTEHTPTGKAVWFRFARAGAPAAPADPVAENPRHVLARLAAVQVDWLTAAGSDALSHLSLAEFLGEILHRAAETLGAVAGIVVVVDEDASRRDLLAHQGLSEHQLSRVRDELVTAPWRPCHGREEMPQALLGDDRGVMVVPLNLDGVHLGHLELDAAEGQPWTQHDRGLAQLAGDRMVLAVTGTRLRDADQRRRGWLGFLAEASDLLAGSLDVQLTLSLVAQLVLPMLGEWSAVYLLDDRGEAALSAVRHVDERQADELRVRLSSAGGSTIRTAVLDTVSAGRAVPLTSQHTEIGLVVPMSARGRTLGALVLGRPSGPRHSAEEHSLAEDLARRAALAVDNARLYGERADVARALQSWLLPPALPAPEGVELAARYLAAGEGNEVGGDFYDVFSLGPDSYGIAVGDVCGKGAEAAAVTGLVRDVIRLLVREGHGVPDVLGRLNSAILEQGDRGRFCTVAAGRLYRESDDVVLRVASAGHPLPVHMRASGELEFVGIAGTLVGVTTDFEVHECEVRLAPGDSVVFYTDGVTERRTTTTMFGEMRLLDTLAESAGRTAAGIAADLEQAVGDYADSPLRDDLAILVVRRLT